MNMNEIILEDDELPRVQLTDTEKECLEDIDISSYEK